MPVLRTRDTQPRPLDLTSDAPPHQPPSLAIIAPTPRAFTFPVSHSLHDDSPYSSPTNSPFEPELRPFVNASSLEPTAIRSLSPPSIPPPPPASTSRPPPSTSKRRKAVSCDVERRPKKGDEDYVKRPENAFILFRRKCNEDRLAAQEEAAAASNGENPSKKPRQADLSRTISEQWKNLPPAERQYWEEKAKEKKKEHEKLYPNYVYRPQRVKDKKERGLRRGEFAHITEHERISFVLPMTSPTRNGRSASAPTPPPLYQSVTVPNLYISSPSSPNASWAARRSLHPFHSKDVVEKFDYVPSESAIAPPFGQGSFEGDLESSQYNSAMFGTNGQRPELQALQLPYETQQLLLPAQQIVSPCSTNSSEPSSPRFEPYTPTSGTLHDAYAAHYSTSPDTIAPTCASDLDLHLGIQLQQLQQDLDQIDIGSFSWADPNALWATSGELQMTNEDFDLNSIPPVQFGFGKSAEDSSSSMMIDFSSSYDQYNMHEQHEHQQATATTMAAHHHQHQFLDEVTLNFDDMMAGQCF